MSTDVESRQLLFVGEAAHEVRVSEATVRRAIQSGELRALRLGEHGRYRIRRVDLDAYVAPVKRRES